MFLTVNPLLITMTLQCFTPAMIIHCLTMLPSCTPTAVDRISSTSVMQQLRGPWVSSSIKYGHDHIWPCLHPISQVLRHLNLVNYGQFVWSFAELQTESYSYYLMNDFVYCRKYISRVGHGPQTRICARKYCPEFMKEVVKQIYF